MKNAIPKGTLLAISREEYSDYQVIAFVRTLQDLDVETVETEFFDHIGRPDTYNARLEKFLPWAIARGFLEIVDHSYKELHIGQYSTVDFRYTERPAILVGD